LVIALAFLTACSVDLSERDAYIDDPYAPPGLGTRADPWQLSEPEHLIWLADPANVDRLAEHFQLMNDITAPQNLMIARRPDDWPTPRRHEQDTYPGFTGIFDGNGFTITVDIYLPSQSSVGLFSFIGTNGRVQNLTVVGNVTGSRQVGGLAGFVLFGHVQHSHSSAYVSGRNHVGGLVGQMIGSSNGVDRGIAFSSASGEVHGYEIAGGLVGSNEGTVLNSFATGNVWGGWIAGGLVGSNDTSREIRNSYATGNVSGGSRAAGGLVGNNWYAIIRYSYATGQVSGENRIGVGSLVGENRGTRVQYSYAGGRVIGTYGSSGEFGERVSPETIATEVFWRETLRWDFDEVWAWDNTLNLPILRNVPGAQGSLSEEVHPIEEAPYIEAYPQENECEQEQLTATPPTKPPYFMGGDATVIAGGEHHTVGLRSDGTVVAVGDYRNGQINVSDWRGIVAVSASREHTIGLRYDGTVVAVGWDEHGQLNVSYWRDIVAISTGDWHTVGLRQDGTVVAVGSNEMGQLNVSDWHDIIAVSAGCHHTVGLRSDGTVVSTGSGHQPDVSEWYDIVAVAGGSQHTVGLKGDGTVIAEGNNIWGELDVSDWYDIVAIAAGRGLTAGLRADGTIVTTVGWHDTTGLRGIISIAAGNRHIVGLGADGTVITVGTDQIGFAVQDVSDWYDIKVP